MDRGRRHGTADTEPQRRGVLNFRSSKQLQFSSVSEDIKKHHNPSSSSRSEDKSLQWPSLRPHQKDQEASLPERLQLLEEFYFAIEASVSLLNIRRATCSFSAVSKSVESSTQRRFLSNHLAQIKHIFPEALKLEEFTSWNSEVQCFQKDLRIKLLPISMNTDEGLEPEMKSASKACEMVVRRKEFHRRLIEFAKSHPKGDADVPEADLHSKTSSLDESDDDIEIGVGEDEEETAAILSHTAFDPSQLKKFPRSPSKVMQTRHVPTPSLSHLPSTFKRHFSARNMNTVSISEPILEPMAMNEEITEVEVNNEHNDSYPDPLGSNASVVIGTPQKVSFQLLPSTPKKEVRIQSEEIIMSPPNRVFINASKCQTPTQTPCSILGNPFASPNCSTPYQEISTPSMSSLASPPPCGTSKGAPQSAPGKKQRQAVIKSLRFGVPSKSGVTVDNVEDYDGSNRFETQKDEEKLLELKEIASPKRLQTAASIASVMKSRRQAINRLLPFDSPKKISHASLGSPNGANVVPLGSPKRLRNAGLKDVLTPSPKRRKISTIPDNVVCHQLKAATCSDQIATEDNYSATDYRLSSSDMDVLQCLPKELLDNVQAKERKLIMDSQNGLEESRRRKQMIAGLPRLFNAVRLIFQSANRTVFTCKDLTRMVVSAHPDIIDQGEIIEQLQLLVNFAPQWISANPSSTGEFIYRIDKSADMRNVSKILSQAK